MNTDKLHMTAMKLLVVISMILTLSACNKSNKTTDKTLSIHQVNTSLKASKVNFWLTKSDQSVKFE
ncbi:MAG: hypothetical protein OEM04_06185, partial [Flavobacteriaceae bacterium]|nr:hypothetical protein [Flavobacteriaceae bacterium]